MANKDIITHEYKILFIGDTSTGKTNLISRYCGNTFSEKLLSTICVEQTFQKFNEGSILFEYNDTASQEYLRIDLDSYYAEADAFVIVYDVLRKNTFDSMEKYYTELYNRYQTKPNAKVFIVGNKTDLISSKTKEEVNRETAMKYAKNKDAQIYFTSAKDNVEITQLFNAIHQQFMKKEVVKVRAKPHSRSQSVQMELEGNDNELAGFTGSGCRCC